MFSFQKCSLSFYLPVMQPVKAKSITDCGFTIVRSHVLWLTQRLAPTKLSEDKKKNAICIVKEINVL